MSASDLDAAGVTREIIVTQLANGFATANVLPVAEEPLGPRATSLLKPVMDKDLGVDNRAEGVASPLIFNHLVQLEVLLHSLSQVQVSSFCFEGIRYNTTEDL